MKIKKQIILAIIFSVVIILFLLTGCKPKQILNERIVTKVDSSAVMRFQSQLNEKTKENETLNVEINRFREENIRLQNEVSSKTTKYDTSKPIIPETGKPPVSEETHTESKTLLESKLSESETDNRELRKENSSLTVTKTNLEYEVEQLRKENKKLKYKTVQQTGFNFRLAGWSFAVGLIVGMLLWWKFGSMIKSFRLWKK